jgi:predicted secreted protein
MDRDTAEKLEGMMLASRAQLEHIAEFVRVEVPAPQQRTIMLKIAAALGAHHDPRRACTPESTSGGRGARRQNARS